jgi:hypothetical protein
MTFEESFHLLHGYSFIRVPPEMRRKPELQDDPKRWAALWSRYRRAVLAKFIATHPGERPVPFWRFDAPRMARRKRGESRVEWLHRAGLLSRPELEAIARAAEELGEFNQYQSADNPRHHWIPPSDAVAFAIKAGLVGELVAAKIAGSQAVAERGEVPASRPVQSVNGHVRNYATDNRREMADVKHNGHQVSDPGVF